MKKEAGIDWSGLLNWSTKYHDGTAPTKIQPLTDEEKLWLTEALKQYTFDDTEKLKELCETM
jgi:hypothetical protein